MASGETKTKINERPWELRIPAFRVFGNLYFVGNMNGASWIVDTSEGPILFDTNYPTMDAMQIQSIWEAGFNPCDIVAIFHSHGHYDHFGATDLIKALSGAKTYLGEADVRMFKERPELSYLANSASPLALFEADVAVHDGDVFTYGDTTIRCVHTPGHSQGATSYFFPVTDGKQTLICGLHGGAGLNTVVRSFMVKHNVNWRQDFLDSIDKLMDEDVDIFIGNHTSQNKLAQKLSLMTEDYNPFIDKGAWKAFLVRLREKFDEMIAQEAAEE